MASRGRTPITSVALLVLSLGVLSQGACTSKFFSLPAATYGPHVYMLELNSADALCKSQGYSKAGAVRKTTLHALGLSVSAIKLRPFEVIKVRSTDIIVSVECLKVGQKACTADKNGNIGTGNQGKNNFGDYNDGDSNIGSYNKGNSNWGDNNKGTNLRKEITTSDTAPLSSALSYVPLSTSSISFTPISFPLPASALSLLLASALSLLLASALSPLPASALSPLPASDLSPLPTAKPATNASALSTLPTTQPTTPAVTSSAPPCYIDWLDLLQLSHKHHASAATSYGYSSVLVLDSNNNVILVQQLPLIQNSPPPPSSVGALPDFYNIGFFTKDGAMAKSSQKRVITQDNPQTWVDAISSASLVPFIKSVQVVAGTNTGGFSPPYTIQL
ncbi:hypothetical protein ACKKBF_B40545 [Auxenochlorella protothecoides x Auxenochlorella symbiontica]